MKMLHEVEGGSSLWEALRYLACCSMTDFRLRIVIYQRSQKRGMECVLHSMPF
jgi:hypothetical protein